MIQFTKPLYLLLLVPMAWYAYWLSMHSLADMSRFRATLALGIRLTILALLIFALAGARVVRNASQQCVVFALDASDSISKTKQAEALAYVNSALKSMRSDQKAALVVFGGDASVEFAPSSTSRIDHIYSTPDTSNSDLSQALGLAFATFPEQCAKKIVLLSDGNETTGRALEQAALAGANDISIDTVPLVSELPKEVLLDRMSCPTTVKIGEPFDLKITAVSKQPTVATIRILRNGAPDGLKTVDLPAGKSVVTFRESIPKPGGFEFKAILETSEDTRNQNNVALANTKVIGKPRVLYVEGQSGQSRYLASALGTSDIVVDTRDRSGLPTSMAELQGYDMLVLSDVPAMGMAPEQMTMIQSAVRDLGIGFTMIGGENGFGAGGYYDTPIEQTLPVDMSVRKTKVLPTLSVVIVMDKSGSMSMPEGGKMKIELADDAAASVVKLLQPIDMVGIVICHDFPVTAVNLRSASNKGPIYREISTIRAEGGGIYAVPSMQMAYKMLVGAPTRQKHVILMADGSDVDDAGPDLINIARAMSAKKITVTTVAFGEGKDVMCLKATAVAGRGYFYLAKYARDLKAIFTKDVMMVSKSLIVEEPFVPKMDSSSPELTGIDTGSTPPLLGYVATSAKAAARVLAVSHRNDPILAAWQYGLGRSVAFTSDCKARWAARWVSWPDYNKFWSQVLRSTMRKSGPRDFQTTVDVESGVARVVVDAVDQKGNFLNFLKFAGSVVPPDLNAHPVSIEQTGPGRYEGTFDARLVGSYVVNVVSKGGDQKQSDVNVISIPYPPEYKDLAPNTALLKRVASETSGRFDPNFDTLFTRDFRRSRTFSDCWRLFALISVVLLPFDIAFRRVAITPEQAVELYHAAIERLRAFYAKRRMRTKAERTETMSALLRAKKSTVKPSVEIPPTIVQPVVSLKDEPKPEAPKAAVKPPPPAASKEAQPESDADTTSRLLEKKRMRKKPDDES